MFLQKLFTPRVSSLLIASAMVSWPVCAQQNSSSSSSSTQYSSSSQQNDAIAAPVPATDQGNQPEARNDTDVALLGQEPDTGGASTPNASARKAAPLPPKVRHVESDVEREARHWRMGARAGVGLDPELVMFGVHSQMGPIFSRNVFFRPNADFEWGEITDMVALNLEAVYRVPHTTHSGEWAPYFGAGPALNFIHQSFKTQTSQNRNISFGNFDYETGFNILMGVQNRHSTFFEVKTSLYSQPAPVLHLIVGKTF